MLIPDTTIDLDPDTAIDLESVRSPILSASATVANKIWMIDDKVVSYLKKSNDAVFCDSSWVGLLKLARFERDPKIELLTVHPILACNIISRIKMISIGSI